MTEIKMNGLNTPETEAEVRVRQLTDEFRAGRIILRIFTAGVIVLALLFGLVVFQVIRSIAI